MHNRENLIQALIKLIQIQIQTTIIGFQKDHTTSYNHDYIKIHHNSLDPNHKYAFILIQLTIIRIHRPKNSKELKIKWGFSYLSLHAYGLDLGWVTLDGGSQR